MRKGRNGKPNGRTNGGGGGGGGDIYGATLLKGGGGLFFEYLSRGRLALTDVNHLLRSSARLNNSFLRQKRCTFAYPTHNTVKSLLKLLG